MKIKNFIYRYLSKPKPIPSGIYHYQSPSDDPRNFRLHLRIHPDGTGLLIVNASTLLHLNNSATEYAYHLINKSDKNEVINSISSRYKVFSQQILEDYDKFIENIEGLLFKPDLDPVIFWGFDRQTQTSAIASSPLRLECALTYLSSNDSIMNNTLKKRVDRELTTDEWRKIITSAWEFGIPHIIFTGGEPTLRQDLPNLIQVAEENGQIAGLITNGKKFQDNSYLNILLNTGLDHIMIIWQHDTDSIWRSLHNIIVEDIFVAVHLTINEITEPIIIPLLSRLSKIGIKAISLSAEKPIFHNQLINARNHIADLQMQLVWDLPVPFFNENPIWAEERIIDNQLPINQPSLYIEPDGDVLISQDSKTVIGNLLADNFENIWLAHTSSQSA